MKILKAKLMSVLLGSLLLAGCATGGYGGYGSGSSYSPRGLGSGSSISNSTVLGVAGAAVGSQVGQNGLIGGVLGGLLGFYGGSLIDTHRSAVGQTECNYGASKSGNDYNGSYTQGARSYKVVRGYKADCN